MTSSSLEGIKELFGKGSVIAGKLIVVYLLSNARVRNMSEIKSNAESLQSVHCFQYFPSCALNFLR